MSGSVDEVIVDVVHRSAHRVSSVAIVGPGCVGTTTAYALLMSGAAGEIVLIGRDRERIEGHVNDLRDATSYSHPGRIVAGDFADCATADVCHHRHSGCSATERCQIAS
jgi:L-lactate dehydrogenase